MLARCGCNCTRCPTYRGNLVTFKDREHCSWGWKTYIGVNLSPGKLRLCDGCLARDEDKPTRYLNCIVRRCAMRNGIKNCAYCALFPCEELATVHSGQQRDYRQSIESRIGYAIPEHDYLNFVEPYEGLNHLHVIHSSLNAADIVAISGVDLKSTNVAFPDDLSCNIQEKQAFTELHDIISFINRPLKGISFARRESEKKQRPLMLTLLWSFGLHGSVEMDNAPCLMLTSLEYYREKNQSQHSILKRYFDLLDGQGIEFNLVPLVDKGWVNPQGFLRAKYSKKKKPTWLIKMFVREEAGGPSLLTALQHYTGTLAQLHGEKAFSLFKKADMTVLKNVV